MYVNILPVYIESYCYSTMKYVDGDSKATTTTTTTVKCACLCPMYMFYLFDILSR